MLRAFTKALVIGLGLMLVTGGVAAQKKGRKLSVGAYLKTAKIEILSGEPERYEYAVAMLDSLFMHYGPHAEGLYLMGQIMVDGIEQSQSLEDKGTYLGSMVAYFDSLRMCCENEEIKKSRKKGCQEYVTISDSLQVKYWREFFNSGLTQLSFAEEQNAELELTTDSSSRSFLKQGIEVNLDSCIQNMKLSIISIADSSRPYLIIDKAYGLKGDYQSGIEWLRKGFDKSNDPTGVRLSIAYDYIKMSDWAGAIPYYEEHIRENPDDMGTLKNLGICYNNAGMYDSAAIINLRVLELEPENAAIAVTIGRYFNSKASAASDSMAMYQQENNSEMANAWSEKKKQAFDSSRVFFRRAYEIDPENVSTAEQYGLVCALLGDYEEAIIGFAKAAELEPERVGTWTSLGDCHLSLKQFDEALVAYQKVVALEPDNRSVWEHLRDLYIESGQKAKRAEAEKKLQELDR
ncbi:MAG: tetratricopeptide repeat protein [bacterium]